MKKYSEQKINEIVELRKNGNSIPEIVRRLSLPKGAVWYYARNVKLPENYNKLLRFKQASARLRSFKEWAIAKSMAENVIKDISPKETLIIISCLYWAEGSKKDLSFCNSDPKMIWLYIRCLQKIGVTLDQIMISLRVFEEINVIEAQNFWATLIGVPSDSVKSISIIKGEKHGKLQYGMCRIRVKGGAKYLKLFSAVRDAIVENI